MAEQVVLVVTVLLFLAAAVVSAVKRVRLPYAVALVLTGAALATLLRRAVDEGLIAESRLDGFELTPGVVLYVLLPILIFQAAFHIESRRLLRNILPIATLAIPAVLISTAVVALLLFLFGDIPHHRVLVAALLFGAMVSTTDAVAVVAIFRDLGAPKRLAMLAEGEALFNTGTALVLFGIILKIMVDPAAAADGVLVLLARGFADFLWLGVGGLVFGAAVGLVCSWLLALAEDSRVEITLTTVCAFASFLAAGLVGVSDVMAVIGAGLTVGNYGRTKISPQVIGPLEHYWAYLAFVANSIVFLLVGLSLRAEGLITYADSIAVAIVAVLIARASGIFTLMPLVNRVSEHKVDLPVQTVMWWGGMRGALVLVVALSLSQLDEQVLAAAGGSEQAPAWLEWQALKPYILHLAFGVVFFTILINAPTLTPLIRMLGIGRITAQDRVAAMQARLLAKREARLRLLGLRDDGVISREVYDLVTDRYVRAEAALRRDLATIRRGDASEFGVDDERRMLLGHCFAGESVQLRELFYRGEIAEWVMKDLHITLDNQLELLKRGDEPDLDELARGGGTRLGDRLRRWSGRLLGRGRIADALRASLVGRDYQLAVARMSSIEAALVEIKDLETAGAISNASLRAVSNFYAGQRDAVRRRFESTARIYPEHTARMQESLSERFCLQSEEDVIRELVDRGRVPEKVAAEAVDEIHDAMGRARSLQKGGARLIRPEELVRRIPFFSELPPADVARISNVLRPISFPAGEAIVNEGDAGDTMYLIATGTVEVEARDEAAPGGIRRQGRLGEGDFFGEIALLAGVKRTATVRAVEPCAVLELSREDLTELTSGHPDLDKAVREAYRARILASVLVHIPAFRRLDDAERGRLAQEFRLRRFAAGDHLFEAGDVQASLWVIERGKVQLELAPAETASAEADPDGAAQTVAAAAELPPQTSLHEGEAFGQQHVCTPERVGYRALAVEPTQALVLAHLELMALIERQPGLRAKLPEVTGGPSVAELPPAGGNEPR
ncbi:cation:proton antiporter [Piscinibacter sakaiensis]|uniref:cation:proton antiporter domain-containing protein n=1 Tax=Piscinibacter sakaiensis TaxID=1547922 RepID=UPI003AAAFD10